VADLSERLCCDANAKRSVLSGCPLSAYFVAEKKLLNLPSISVCSLSNTAIIYQYASVANRLLLHQRVEGSDVHLFTALLRNVLLSYIIVFAQDKISRGLFWV
jgi:hypothetical protein